MRGYAVNPPATTPPPPSPGKSKKTKVEIKDNMTYQDTAIMMLSDDYEERFKAEYWQLKIRYERLYIMSVRWDRGYLDFESECPRSLYTLQLDAMKQYLTVLEARAKIEGINLLEGA